MWLRVLQLESLGVVIVGSFPAPVLARAPLSDETRSYPERGWNLSSSENGVRLSERVNSIPSFLIWNRVET